VVYVTVRSVECIVSNCRTISKTLIGKDLEGSGGSLV
jgi:hypothetical protein